MIDSTLVALEAKQSKRKAQQHLVVHSLLHLAGEDHQTPAQATQMETQEIAILATLGWPNPYEIA
jgi:probable rRNA maturation factor